MPTASAVEGMRAFAPSPVKFTGEGAAGPAKIATDPDSPSAPVRLRIWQRSGNPHPNPLPGHQGEGIHKVLASDSPPALFTLRPVFRQSLSPWEGSKVS